MRRDNCVNEPNGGSHFAVYTCINSSCCTHEIYTMLYVNFISVMAGKKSTDLQFSKFPSALGSMARCLPGELRVESKTFGLLLFASHSWFPLCLNNGEQERPKSNTCHVVFIPHQGNSTPFTH